MYYVLQDEYGEPFAIIDESRYEEAEAVMESIDGDIVEAFEITDEAIYPVPDDVGVFSFGYNPLSREMYIVPRVRREAIFGERIKVRQDDYISGQVIARDREHAKIRAMALAEKRPCPLTT